MLNGRDHLRSPEAMSERTSRITPTSLSISSLLNNPNATQSYITRPSTREIPLVHLTPIPTATIADFSSYISTVGSEYDNYIRAKQYGLQQHLQSNQLRPRIKAGSIFSGTDGMEARVADHIPSSVAASSRASFDDASSVFSGHNDSPGSELTGFSFGEVSPSSQIPAIFGEDDFELKNPRTFDLVSGKTSIVASLQAQGSTSTNPSQGIYLQEKLSAFMDTVETTLVEEISATGPAFFDALEDLRDLQSRANSCIDRIEVLRDEFARLSADNADVRIERTRLEQKRLNTSKLRQGVENVQTLNRLYRVAIAAAESDTPRKCIEALTAFNQFLAVEESVQGLQIVEQMQYNVSKVKYTLGQSDIATFKRILSEDISEQLQKCDTDLTIDILRSRHIRDRKIIVNFKSAQPGDITTDAIRSGLEANLDSLVFTDQVQSAYNEYKDNVVKEVKLITKRSLPVNEDDDTQSVSSGQTNRTASDKSTALAKSLRNMSAIDFNDMLRDIYARTCVFVRRISAQQKLLIDLISSTARAVPPNVQDSIYSTHLALTVVEVCQARIIKLLNVRSVVNTEMSFKELRRYYELNVVFNSECEALTGQYGSSLQSVVVGQIKAAYARHADVAAQSLISAVEVDSWQPANLAVAVQTSVDALLDSTTQNPSCWQDALPIYAVSSDVLCGEVKNLVLQETKFIVPLSAAVLISCVEQLLSVGQLLPLLRIESTGNLIELLRLYNSRSCQLILGAGATRSAGLERITAKHLAVTSQALAIVIVLVPCIKAYLMRQNVPPTLLNEFDKLYKVCRSQLTLEFKFLLWANPRIVIHGSQVGDTWKVDLHHGRSDDPDL